jgi:hypothetical protein
MRRTLLRLALPLVLLRTAACGGSAEAPPASLTKQPETQQAPASETAPPPQPGTDAAPPVAVQIAPLPKDGRTPDPALPLVRELTGQFYRGELAKLHKRFSTEMKATLTLERLTELRAKVEKDYGKEVEVLGEDWQYRGNYRGFVRWARFDRYPGPIEVIWMLHKDDDQVAGLFVQPAQNQPKQ